MSTAVPRAVAVVDLRQMVVNAVVTTNGGTSKMSSDRSGPHSVMP